mmetsp:Transcript_20984/g.31871  ORF Transcript_20984/g.31871 Transcript_20984/m.31871 type:complete len:1279 (+) Transcript_20984:481-4317(+)
MVSSRRSAKSAAQDEESNKHMPYEEIIGEGGGHNALSQRLVSFRKWVQGAGCTVHPAVCIVNGEATDGTRNAPVLILGPPPSHAAPALSKPAASAEGRSGMIDNDEDRILYDRTIGCQIRTAREMKEGQVMMKIPRAAMVHPDLIAASDAGRAVLACCEPLEESSYGNGIKTEPGIKSEAGIKTEPGNKYNFWDAFGNTAEKEKMFVDKISSSGGTQLLVKILHERKKVESALAKAANKVKNGEAPSEPRLAKKGSITTRAALLFFLIQQRFADSSEPEVCSGLGSDIGNDSSVENGSNSVERIGLFDGTPETFAPYARTLPPSVPLPINWKRNELALLAGCIPGTAVLQEVAGQILTLSSDLISLVEAGILHRFPTLLSDGMLTWDRWMWAASVHMSRILPASCYLNKGEEKAESHVAASGEVFYSPPEVWDELGVMIPLLDMLNHESEESQIKWESPTSPIGDGDYEMDMGENDGIAKVIIQKRVKKGAQIYTKYGNDSSKDLMLKYGFAQMANDSDTLSIGWAINDCVGNIPGPSDYISLEKASEDVDGGGEAGNGDVAKSKMDTKGFVYESLETDAINHWWSDDRWSIIEGEIKSDPTFWTSMKKGKKMTGTANSDGTFDPILLTAMTVATMTSWAIQRHKENLLKATEAEGEKIQICMTKHHQQVLRSYMLFFFTRKMERLLQNLGNGLQAHFNNINLWTKSTEGFLDHNNSEETETTTEGSLKAIGWNSFFDTYAYNAAMEVEARYYSLAPDSCVLTLYDGNLRSLQASINGVISEEAFKKSIVPQLENLGFVVSDEHFDEELVEDVIVVDQVKTEGKEQNNETKNFSDAEKANGKDNQKKPENDGDKGSASGEKKERKKQRQRNRKQGGPPAIKLHIGNLSYQTVPSRLFDFFAMRYGRENVVECHIPTERETGKSRGFGFVTLTEAIALRVLGENAPHEIDGRVVKLAESNTSIQARSGSQGGQGGGAPPALPPSDRCSVCGYRPRYCTCPSPNMPGFQHGGGFPGGPGGPMNMMGPPPGRHPDEIYGPGPHGPGPGPGPYLGGMDRGHGPGRGMNPDLDGRGGRRRSRSWNRGRSRSPSPRNRRREDSRERYRDRERRGRSYSRSRSRSRSRSITHRDRDRRDRDRRDRDRDRNWDSRRSSRRSRGSSRRSSRYSRSRSRSMSRSPSYSKESSSRRERERERKSSGNSNMETTGSQSRNARSRSRSKSISGQGRDPEMEHSKREGGKSSRRVRSRSKERNPRSRKRSKGSRRSKDSSKRSRSRSRSRSF